MTFSCSPLSQQIFEIGYVLQIDYRPPSWIIWYKGRVRIGAAYVYWTDHEGDIIGCSRLRRVGIGERCWPLGSLSLPSDHNVWPYSRCEVNVEVKRCGDSTATIGLRPLIRDCSVCVKILCLCACSIWNNWTDSPSAILAKAFKGHSSNHVHAGASIDHL
jgi:hypothetical protein